MVLLEFKSLGSFRPNKGHIDAVATKKHPRKQVLKMGLSIYTTAT